MAQRTRKRWLRVGLLMSLFISTFAIANEQGGEMPFEETWEEADVSQVANGHVRNWLLRNQSDLRRERERLERWIQGPDETFDFVLHAQDRFAHVNDYATPEAMTDAFVQSLHSFTSVDDASTWTMFWGFDLPFEFELELPYATLRNGDTLAMPLVPGLTRGPQQTRDIERFSMLFRTREIPADEDHQVERIGGQFKADIPMRIEQLTLHAADVGETQPLGGYLITLLSIENGRFTVNVRRSPDRTEVELAPLRDHDLIGEGIAADGRLVEQMVQTRFNSDYLATLNQFVNRKIEHAIAAGDEVNQQVDIDAWDDAFRELERPLLEADERLEGEGIEVTYAAFGGIDSARLTLLEYAETPQQVQRDIELPVVFWAANWPTTVDSVEALPVTAPSGPVYESPRVDDEIPPESLAQHLLLDYVTHLDEQAMDSQPQVEEVKLIYPDVYSNWLVQRSDRIGEPVRDSLQFYDKQGNHLALPDDEDTVQVKRGALMYQPKAFSAWPYRVTLQLPVTQANGFERTRYALGELPEHIVVTGNRVTVVDGEPQRVGEVVMAGDEHGLLKPLVTTKGRTQAMPFTAVLYYGEPRWIEVWTYQERAESLLDVDISLRGPMDI